MQDIVGHKKIISFFDTVIHNEHLSHAYCFSGPEHVGKHAVALSLAMRICGLDSVSHIASYPDIIQIHREIHEKTGGLKKDISIEQVRSMLSRLIQGSFYKDSYKVVIIDEAHVSSSAASNALLKTLEETGKKTVIILISPHEDLLLPTIASRCQHIHFSLVSPDDMTSLIDIDNEEQQEMLTYAAGRPGLLMTWLADNDAYIQYREYSDIFTTLFGKALYEKINILDPFFGNKKDHIRTRDNLHTMLDVWKFSLVKMFKQKQNMLSVADIITIEHDISHAQSLLKKNIHPRLLCEHILCMIP